MEVIPAIDIRGGKCVQLYQGDYGRETVYSDEPVDMASRWVALGASRLHVVDLDGARTGVPVNMGLAGAIASAVSVSVQLGGGIRTLDAAREASTQGIGRVVMGTAAIEDQGRLLDVCSELGAEAVVVGVDARNGYIAVDGWTTTSRIAASELVKRVEEMGVLRFMYTDISRDGTLTEPNFRAIADLAASTDMKMLVAGGISSVGHLKTISELGAEAAIIGTAIYTGDIDLPEAIAAVGAPASKPTGSRPDGK